MVEERIKQIIFYDKRDHTIRLTNLYTDYIEEIMNTWADLKPKINRQQGTAGLNEEIVFKFPSKKQAKRFVKDLMQYLKDTVGSEEFMYYDNYFGSHGSVPDYAY